MTPEDKDEPQQRPPEGTPLKANPHPEFTDNSTEAQAARAAAEAPRPELKGIADDMRRLHKTAADPEAATSAGGIPEEMADEDRKLELEYIEWQKEHAESNPEEAERRAALAAKIRGLKINNTADDFVSDAADGCSGSIAEGDEMNSPRKSKAKGILVALAIVAGLGWWGLHSYTKSKLEKDREATRLTIIAKKVADLSDRFDATPEWENAVSSSRYSQGMQEAFANTGHKAILINRGILDVSLEGSKYLLYIAAKTNGNSKQVGFVLECDPSIAERVIKQNSNAEYAIVAQVESVQEQQDPDTFLCHGRCLELMLKEDNGR